MKQMTKEELIEYFIEQLGDNEILGKFMTIDQIREKLNDLIVNVTYNSEEQNIQGSCEMNKDGKMSVNFSLINQPDIMNEKIVIVHELLHVLSASSIQIEKGINNEIKRGKVRISY